MNALDSIKIQLRSDIERLNALIRTRLSSGNPLMDTVIEGYLTSKGKQIRPILVMLCAGMFGSVDERVLNAAAAVELLHNASLIHDDVVDDSKLRRNRPTVNAVWDNHIAVLVGDFFVSTSLQRAIATGDVRIVEAIGNLGKLLSLGEIDQIYNAREHTQSEASYFKVIDHKTASLFVACARVGCYAVDAPADATDTLAEVARLLGLCFQIRDDIFDYFDGGKVGKPTGNDLREGKITLPLLHILESGEAPEAEAMLASQGIPELDDAQIAELTRMARERGGIDYAYTRMAALRAEARAHLDRLPRCDSSAQLARLFDFIISREY